MMDEFIVKEFGDTAVVWFTLHLVGPVKGERVQNDYRFTDVFVMRDGRWQCVSSQSTRVNRDPSVESLSALVAPGEIDSAAIGRRRDDWRVTGSRP